MPALAGRTPLQAWLGDPTPVTEVPAEDLRLLMLEDDGRTRKITTKGVSWRARHYVGAWMTGQVGREVRIRHMPHHEHEVEVFDATTAQHLGAATHRPIWTGMSTTSACPAPTWWPRTRCWPCMRTWATW